MWTNYRVMEWLKEIDLQQYASGLGRSGVHGGLIMNEPSFSDVGLADVLCIPIEKTLLRRHLSTQFKQLVGRDNVQRKREYQNSTPLSPSAKVRSKCKPVVPATFILRKNVAKVNSNCSDLVCPYNNSNMLSTTQVYREQDE